MAQLAFPTAYGGGAYASGGRGGNVYKVTNLLDDGSVGSFRWAVTQARPATIIFDVSGTIELTSSLIVQGDDLTVAGQTAPQGGITITSDDKNIRFGISRFNSIENHIWRYIKVRAQYQGNDEYQNIQQYAGNDVSDYTRNIIMDHLSISGAQYMAYSIRGEGSENVTLQNIMFGENAKTALFGDTDDLFSKDFTFRNNTMYHSTHRVPNTSAQNVDVYNNVVYDWKFRLTVIKNGTAINHFNNYYYKGTRTNLGSSWNGAPENFTWEVNGITTNATDPVTIYSKNNVIQDLYVYDDNDADISNEFQDDRYIWMHHAGQLVDGTEIIPDRQQRNKADDSYFVENPMSHVGRIPSTFLTAEEAKTAVPNDSGAYKYLKDDGTVGEFRDALDTEYHSNIINDNATNFAYDGGVNDPINSTLFTNFVASISTTPINSRPVDFYDTNDYIPQAYLDAKGITGNSTIHNEIQPSGYTLLEEYMNQVDEVEQLAFPTAVGAGAYATGGRGGKVCHVDTLTWDTAVVYDAATDSYSGGFYNMFYELDIPAKEIVFTVSGTIVVPSTTVLNFASKTNQGNITVSGQTSNIVFSTDYFQIQNAKNLIWRYTSFYKRDDQAPGSDVVWVNSSENDITENIIFDHCSFYYGGDECFSVTSSNGEVNNVTAQWCLMAASSKGSIIGAYTGQSNATTAYCSYQDISYRFPNMLGYGSNSQQDAYNIFVGNYTSRLIRTTGDANFNVQNMYVQANRADYGKHRMQYQSTAPCQLYAGGTIITGVQDTPAYPEFDDVWTTFSGSDIGADLAIPNDARASSAFPLIGKAGIIYDTADVKTEVLPYTGNTKRLANDGSVIEDEYALDTFYRDLGINKVSTSDQTRYPTTQYPEPNSATALTSTLKDGIPDTWRAANMNGESHNDIVAETGYTWLETFHNQVDSAQQLAFPTAMGAGAYTSGARGQEVYHVTNLNATGSGSFRDAISQSNRTIVFDVSGIIDMIPEFQGDDILIEANNLTIAGQTAPEGNITITGARLVFRGSNVIVRYMKFRSTDNVGGAINSANESDVIFDHLSVSSVETNQVAIGMTNNPGIPAYNRTTQNSLIAYCGLGMIIGDTTPPNDTDNETYSLINNAFVFTGHRIPAKIAGAVHMDIINNLSHGHSARLIRIDDWSYNLNHVGNYYQMGRPMQQMHTAYYGTRNGLIYENDNYYDPNFSGDEWERFLGDEAPLPPSKFVQSPFTYQNSETLNILSSGDLKTQILPYVGCYKYINDSGQVVENRDSVDSQAIDDLINNVTRGSVSEFVDITISDIPTSNNTRPGGFYGTNQHIPTTWLTANGYADTTTIHNEVESDGYTVLEHYINQVDSSDTPTPPDPPVSAVSGSTRSLILKGII